MKVGMVCPYDWSYPGGVRSHITGLVPALKRRGVEVQIIAPASQAEPDIFRAGRTIGIPFNGSVARLCFSMRARNAIAARLARGDLDLLHIHEPASPSVGLLALTVSRIPVVATFHAASAGSRAYALARPLLARPFRRIAVRIAVSSEALRLVSAHFPGNYEQIPNGIDRRLFSSAVPRAQLQALKPFVLFVGRDEPRKGLSVALEAMQVVRRSFDARLVVAGATSMRLPDWATRLGAVPNRDLPSVYRAADVFVAPSLRGESFGIVLAEAMAAGVPVVCSDLPGYVEAAAGAASVFPAGDAAAAGASILRLLKEPGLGKALIDKGNARAAELDWDVLSEKVLASYRRAVS